MESTITLDRILTFLMAIVIMLYILCGGMYLRRAKQKEDVKEKLFIKGVAWSNICTAVMLIFWILPSFLQDTFTQFVFSSVLTEFAIRMTPTIFYYAFERAVKRTKYVLTIINIAILLYMIIGWSMFFIFGIAIPNEVVMFIRYFTHNIYFNWGFPIVIILFTLFSRLEGKAIGCIFFLSQTINSLGELFIWVRHTHDIGYIIGPLLFIICPIMRIIPLFINPKYFSRVLKFWPISGVIMGFLYFFCWSWFFFLHEPIIHQGYRVNVTQEFLIRGIIWVILSFFQYLSIKREVSEDKKDILLKGYDMYLRPQKLTEEEVTIHREKKICLVCKGKIGGFNTFICTSCNALYCEKCAKALANLENMCWSCESPIDPLKPVKPPEEEEGEEIIVSKKDDP